MPRRRVRPRWGRLYAIIAGAAVASAVTRAGLPASPLRSVGLVAIPVLTAVAMAWWVATNRVALDLTEWCDCARGTMRVRVVMFPAPQAAPAPPKAARPRPLLRTTLQE